MYIKHELKISTIVHIGILICFIISPIIFPHKYKYNRPTVHTVQLISLPAIRPQQAPTVTKPPKPIAPKPKPKQPGLTTKSITKPIPKPLTTPTLEEKLSKRLDEIDREEPTATVSTTQKNWSEPGYTPQFTTTVSSPSDFPFQYYLDLIHDKISSCWYEPQMVLDKQYTAIVTFTIMQDGSIQNVYIKKSSGISNFDQSGIKAIELARPFPQLPQGFSHSQLTVNVAFNLQ